MARDTRERILEAALELFSRDGYAGTNMKDIADAVGIVKSALYRHFESKEEIWNAARDMVAEYYAERLGNAGRERSVPENTEELYDMTVSMVDFTIHDPQIIRMRKILAVEQFRDRETASLASSHFLYNMETTFTRVFGKMMEKGTLKKADPQTLALCYTAPITVLIHLCDREPEKEKETLEKIGKCIREFISVYGV